MTGHTTAGSELCWSYCCCDDASQTCAMTDSLSCTCHDNTMMGGWTTGRAEKHAVRLCCEVSLWLAFEASALLIQETKGQRRRHSYNMTPTERPQTRSSNVNKDQPETVMSHGTEWHDAQISLMCGKLYCDLIITGQKTFTH